MIQVVKPSMFMRDILYMRTVIIVGYETAGQEMNVMESDVIDRKICIIGLIGG